MRGPRRSRVLLLTALFAVIAVVAAGCGGDDGGESGSAAEDSGSGDTSEQETDGESDDGSGGSGGFDEVEMEEGVVARVPAGWTLEDEQFGTFVPPDGTGLDPMVTGFRVVSSCAGACEPKSADEWQAGSVDEVFGQFDDEAAFTISRDEELANGRVVVAENDFGNVSVAVARWQDGAERYLWCMLTAKADEVDDALLADAEEACVSTTAPFLE